MSKRRLENKIRGLEKKDPDKFEKIVIGNGPKKWAVELEL